MRYLNLILAALTIPLIGCSTNSTGKYKGQRLTVESPLIKYIKFNNDEHNPGLDHETRKIAKKNAELIQKEAIWQLEDCVETAASEYTGIDIDFPTPDIKNRIHLHIFDSLNKTFSTHKVAIELDQLHNISSQYLINLTRNLDSLKHPTGQEIKSLINSYLMRQITLKECLPVLRELEDVLLQSLNIGLIEARENQLTLDSFIVPLSGFTSPKSFVLYNSENSQTGLDLSVYNENAIHIRLSNHIFSNPEHTFRTYSHEIYHGIIEKFTPVRTKLLRNFKESTEEQKIIEETSCEVFEQHLYNYILKREIRRSQINDTTIILSFPQKIPYHFLFEKSLDLYPNPEAKSKQQKSRDIIFTRYSYNVEPSKNDTTLSRIRTCFDNLGPVAFAMLIPSLDFDRLEKLAIYCNEKSAISVAEAKSIIN